MILLGLTFLEAGLLAWLFVFLVDLGSLLWLEIVLGILIGLVVSVGHRIFILFLMAIVNNHSKPQRKLNMFYFRCVCSAFMILTRVHYKVEGLENFDYSRSYLFIGNHKSNEDFMYTSVPLRKLKLGFLAKMEVQDSFFGVRYAKQLDCVLLNRSNDKEGAKSIIKVINNIKEGTSMMIFPEGLRTDRSTNKMLEGHAGSYKVALKAKCPIVPVSMINTHKIMKNAPFRKTKVKVIFHKPIEYDEFKDLSTIEIEEKVRNIINESIPE